MKWEKKTIEDEKYLIVESWIWVAYKDTTEESKTDVALPQIAVADVKVQRWGAPSMMFDHFHLLLVHRQEEGKLEESGYKEKFLGRRK
jgi:hypothetical protein